MRKAYVSLNGIKTGTYQFTYQDGYHDVPVSLTLFFELFLYNSYTDYYYPNFIKELK